MTRRRVSVPVDTGRDLHRWAALIRDVHAAVEGGKTDLKALADAALSAREVWAPPVAWPHSLVSKAFAGIVLAYGRQTDAAVRETLTPLMLASAGMVDELVSAAGVAATASAPRDDLIDAVVHAHDAMRLPYAEN